MERKPRKDEVIMQKHAKEIFWNAMLLTAATLLMRTVGVSFQVYVSNRAGAEAMGLFSLMSGVYGFALTLATSGIHLGVTHIVVDAIGKNEPERIGSAMKKAILYATSFGLGAAILLALFAEPIGYHWLKDPRTVSSLRLFGITLPFIALSSALGGYFTAVRRAYKNAVVQVFEQMLKIVGTMYLLGLLLPFGVEATCCAMVLGGTVAELASFLLEWMLYAFDRRRHFSKTEGSCNQKDGKKLVGIALPIAFTAYLRSGLVTLQHILIPEGLRNGGAGHTQALIAYGSIHSMALPIVLYPASIISSFSGLLVPELAECRVTDSKKRITYMIGRVWSLSLIFSIGVAGILICFSAELGEALYPSTDTAHYIRILAPLIPIMYIDTATDAMMKGLGEQVYSMNINIADALISVVMVWFLVPRYGINGYLVTIYVSELFNTVFSVTHLLNVGMAKPRPLQWIYKPLICIVGATFFTKAIFTHFKPSISSNALSLVIHISFAVFVYAILLLVTRAVEREDLQWLGSFFKKEQRS